MHTKINQDGNLGQIYLIGSAQFMFRDFSYYNQGEVKDFEGNECEWPIFYTFLIIDGVFKTNTEQIEEYQAELRKCMYADANGGN